MLHLMLDDLDLPEEAEKEEAEKEEAEEGGRREGGSREGGRREGKNNNSQFRTLSRGKKTEPNSKCREK